MTARTFTFTVQAPPPPGTNDLDTAINALSVGGWAEFKTSAQFPQISGLDFWWEPGGGGGSGSGADNILSFIHKGAYDAARKKVFIVSASYNSRHYFVTFDQQANGGVGAWSRSTKSGDIVHIWDHAAYNPASGHFQYYDRAGFGTYRLNVDTGAVSSAATGPWTSDLDTSMHTFFAARNEFVAINRNGVVRTLAAGGSTWQPLTSDGGGDRGYQSVSAYDSITGTYYYGGGHLKGNSLWKLTTAGVASLVTNLAPDLFCKLSWLMPVRNAAGTAMDLLVFNRSTGAVSKSTNGGSSWTSAGTMPGNAYDSGNGRMVGIPLVDHPSGRGVVMIVNGENETAWLYRHS